METLIIAVFFTGYLMITMEDKLKMDKLVPALVMMALSWAFVHLGLDSFTQWFDSTTNTFVEGFESIVGEERAQLLESTLLHHLGKTTEILVFLIGAMTIVEMVDYFDGFSVIKGYIKTRKKVILLWIVGGLAFILSSIIDNLTATIVLITILRKLLNNHSDRMWYAGLIVVCANAGGAWSPIGDVTTTMLWMGGKVTAIKLMEFLFLPSFICFVIPTIIASFMKPFKGKFEMPEEEKSNPKAKLMFYFGLGMIVLVPILKGSLSLAPYIGMMFSLAIVSIVAERISARQFKQSTSAVEAERERESPTHKALTRVEMPSILFFLGILMAVGALESIGVVYNFGVGVQEFGMSLGYSRGVVVDSFIVILGIASAIIDNVPLVAASMGMFVEPTDNLVWHFIAYSAGTGGSILIIGSAAGVIAMGMEKIPFFWYLKNISWLALIGFLGGAAFYLLERFLDGTMTV